VWLLADWRRWCNNKRTLREAEFPARPARFRAPLYVALVVLVTVLAAWLTTRCKLEWIFQGADAKSVAQLILSIGVLLIGYQQWRDARQEASFERFYDRLNIANSRREKLGADPFTMYVFAELDNLEYVIERYKLGYMSAELACRGLETFKSRCRQVKHRLPNGSDDTPSLVVEDRWFRDEVKWWVENAARAAYLRDTRRVAQAVLPSCKPE